MSTPDLSLCGTTASVNCPKDFVSPPASSRPLDVNSNQAPWDVISNLWDLKSNPKSNSNGYVSLSLAENNLMHNELRDYINAQQLIDPPPPASSLTYGSGPYGSPGEMAQVEMRILSGPGSSSQRPSVQPSSKIHC
ncbi:hypothetical protein B5807_01900 [Epicoccum nigrum]|uniref:Uncharacterized protein n=1 Tax=Epicoccum nigrum TaxID=105696 RepID=A0A1Y2MCH5_EPING|nr:hypothetical protein B5807_01900 [Epicoccum nigrum]